MLSRSHSRQSAATLLGLFAVQHKAKAQVQGGVHFGFLFLGLYDFAELTAHPHSYAQHTNGGLGGFAFSPFFLFRNQGL